MGQWENSGVSGKPIGTRRGRERGGAWALACQSWCEAARLAKALTAKAFLPGLNHASTSPRQETVAVSQPLLHNERRGGLRTSRKVGKRGIT
jgi:hypothetical protein